jgi:uncharacterized protein (DUF1800 family)
MKRAMRGLLAGLVVGLTVSACGGESSGPTPTPPAAQAPQQITVQDANRLLTQGTFGPTDAAIDTLRNQGISTWITNQVNAPRPSQTHQAFLEERLVELRQANPNANLNPNQFYYSWWRQAVTAEDQLRQRMAFALSQIFVISLLDGAIDVRGAGSYYDMLQRNALGNFRTLLEDVTLHPMMGIYLTYLANQKEDPAGTRTPDENYAREVMQLMTIGLVELNPDGTPRTNAQGQPIPSYTSADIAGLAKVFTGLSWFHPTPTTNTFNGRNRDPDAAVRPMIFYPAFHSTSAKTFLGTTIAAQTTADGPASLRVALDTLFNHPNVGPFIAERLIQQLVTSNPSPDYVRRVAQVFANNGSGTRGDLAAVARAILTDAEARNTPGANGFGKLREPVLRVTHWARAFGATSQSGNWLIPSTSSSQSLGQSPLASPSVFNFWRPGFVPPGTTELGQRNLRAPEFQIVSEVSVAGYVNTLQGIIANGFGASNDVRASYTAELALADNTASLMERIDRLLFGGAMPSTLRTRITEAVNSIAIPGGTATQAQIDTARLNRVRTAILLAMASPDYLVQR